MILLTSDLHLTDRTRDDYRFGLFPWLAGQQLKYNVSHTLILGDITDSKDNHSAALVNRLVDGLRLLKPPVIILRGNHDGINPTSPFFKFLDGYNGISFVTEPRSIGNFFLIPHCSSQSEFDAAASQIQKGQLTFLHQTVEGAISEAKMRLSGMNIKALVGAATVWSGDIHRPQQCGPVTYVGAPYHVRFGDGFEPRCLLYHNGKQRNIQFPAPRKLVLNVTGPDDIMGAEGDQVKLNVQVNREDLVNWVAIKNSVLDECKNQGLQVFGVSLKIIGPEAATGKTVATKNPADILNGFCDHEGIGEELRDAGRELVEEATTGGRKP